VKHRELSPGRVQHPNWPQFLLRSDLSPYARRVAEENMAKNPPFDCDGGECLIPGCTCAAFRKREPVKRIIPYGELLKEFAHIASTEAANFPHPQESLDHAADAAQSSELTISTGATNHDGSN
jgi:hypothetical protein